MVKIKVEHNHIAPKQGSVSIYKGASGGLLEIINDRIEQEKVSFLLSTNPIFVESAQLACAFSYYLSKHSSGQETLYKTFFCNSSFEAVQGAIKIARHKSLKKKSTGRVIIFDHESRYQWMFDPLKLGENRALVPGINFVSKEKELDALLKEQDKLAAVVCVYHTQFSDELIRSIKEKCATHNIIFILDTTQTDIQLATSTIERLKLAFDIVVWGDQLANDEVPFGAFSMRDAISIPWNTLTSCFTHSSTYGGNGLSMSVVKHYFFSYFPQLKKDKKLELAWEEIETSQNKKIDAFSRYINAISPMVYKAAKLDLDVVRAYGTTIEVKNKEDHFVPIIDGVGGCGCALRGHNPKDVVDEVLSQHQLNYSYWLDLTEKLKTVTGFNNAFPAVSGATAVEIAMGVALAANNERRKIITFKGNYAGKTLVSLNATWGKDIHDPFAPLYPHMVFIDPAKEGALQTLEAELQSGDVALVWFEGMQGKALEVIPETMIQAIAKHKKDQHYYIGIDEVLNGFYRTGDFFSFNPQQIEVDVVTLSKGISDMIFPMAVTLVSKDLYKNAFTNYPELVMQYETRYLNQLGAHVGLHALNKAIELGIGNNVKKMGNMLQSGLKKIAQNSPLLKDIEGKGLHLHLCIEAKRFPFNFLGKQFSEMVISRLCFTEGNVLIFFARLLPPLNINEQEVEKIIQAVDKVFSKSKFYIFCVGIGQIGALIGRMLGNALGRR